MPKYDLEISPPVLNAAGSLGFAPDRRSGQDWTRFGAFVTNPISMKARSPAQGARCLPFAGGFLLHTGYPNPGFRAALTRYAPVWGRGELPVFVHLLAERPDELAEMARRLETVEGVMGIELGLPPGLDEAAARQMVEAALGELALIVRLPFEQALELGRGVIEAGAAAVSLGAPRGMLPGLEGRRVEGRLYGPAVFPQALQLTRQLAEQGLPLIAGGGVYSDEQAAAMLAAGARAVAWDAALWLGKANTPG